MGDRTAKARRWAAAAALLACLLAAPAASAAAPAFTFAAQPAVALPHGTWLVAVSDVNGDGHPDLVLVERQSDAIAVMLGNGAGGFGPARVSPTAGRPAWAYVADFNGDGHPDVLAALETKAVERELNPLPEALEVMLGDGAGDFAPAPLVALPEKGYPAVGDFNGDGRVDAVEFPGCFAELNSDSEMFHTFFGDGHGGLSAGPSTAAERGTCTWQAGDFSGDGRSDLLANIPGPPGGDGELVVRPGKADGTFGAPLATADPPMGSGPISEPVDLDGNGTLDLIEGRFAEPASLYVLSGTGDARFTAAGPYSEGQPGLTGQVAVGDFAGTGPPEIVVLGGQQLTAMEPGPGGGLTPRPLGPVYGLDSSIHPADLNGDGRADLVLGGYEAVQIYLNEPPPSAPHSVRAGTPLITGLGESARRWREGRTIAHHSRGLPAETRFSFTLSARATVKLAFARHLNGRRHRGRCLAGARRGRPCRLTRAAGTVSLDERAGRDTIRFNGRLSAGRRLTPGSYTLTMTATDAAGASLPARLSFVILP